MTGQGRARPTLRAHGLSVQPPPGWDAHIYRRADDGDGSVPHPVLHAATMPLPTVRGDFGSGAVDTMRPGDVLVALVEQDAAAADTPLFAWRGVPRLRAADFGPYALQRTLPGQSGCQRFFTHGGRAFCLYVVLGSHAGRARLVPRAQELLDSLTIQALR